MSNIRPTAARIGGDDDVLAALDKRLRELDARRAELTELIISAEKMTVTRDGLMPDLNQAQALLDGKNFIISRELPVSALAALHTERNVIDRALKIGLSQQQRLAAEKGARIWAHYFGEIAEIEKTRVLLAIQLQKVNEGRERLRVKIVGSGGSGCLPTDGRKLLGLREDPDHDEVSWAVERLIIDGIFTRSEIEARR